MHEATLAARNFAEAIALAEVDASRLAIVVEELVTNLYDHGGLGDDAMFTIDLSATDAEVVMILTDPGKPFDPASAKVDAPTRSRGGGAGLKLLRAWASYTHYQTVEGRNRLRLSLPRTP
ncbi:MAG TPA: ATP-binding protein [Sphingomicrobium sp.]|nr:ATP-binding protein [Sphingomicrobium sp.]